MPQVFVDHKRMLDLVTASFELMVYKMFDERGVAALLRVRDFVERLLSRIASEVIRGKLVVVQPLDGAALDLPSPIRYTSLEEFADRLFSGNWILQPRNTEILVWEGIPRTAEDLSKNAVVYMFDTGEEHIYARGDARPVPKLISGGCSQFAVPTFLDVGDAIVRYSTSWARHSTCFTLQDIWADAEKMRLRNKPEYIMRRSLHQYLASVLRGAEVRPEQIVDETHPVDIKVSWLETSKHALIEIKWLGKSIGEDSSAEGTVYYDSRAQEGADQLAGYLDKNKQTAPAFSARGYLVVYDARRYGEGKTRAHRLYYEHREINFTRRHELSRQDFHNPVRIFLMPVLESE